jgi:hypothetical protein
MHHRVDAGPLNDRQSGVNYGSVNVAAETFLLAALITAAIAAAFCGPASVGLISSCMFTFRTIGFGAGTFAVSLT